VSAMALEMAMVAAMEVLGVLEVLALGELELWSEKMMSPVADPSKRHYDPPFAIPTDPSYPNGMSDKTLVVEMVMWVEMVGVVLGLAIGVLVVLMVLVVM